MGPAIATKSVFVTVGTTSFDALINYCLDQGTLEAFDEAGYNKLVLQVGRGVEPVVPSHPRIEVSWYRLKDSIQPDLDSASLVISHAGAGSCLEALGAGKPLVVVVNPSLMGNHQQELADKLHSERHAVTCHPQTLASTLKQLRSLQMRPFPPINDRAFSNYMDKLMGFV